jgi:hypothetical protein
VYSVFVSHNTKAIMNNRTNLPEQSGSSNHEDANKFHIIHTLLSTCSYFVQAVRVCCITGLELFVGCQSCSSTYRKAVRVVRGRCECSSVDLEHVRDSHGRQLIDTNCRRGRVDINNGVLACQTCQTVLCVLYNISSYQYQTYDRATLSGDD